MALVEWEQLRQTVQFKGSHVSEQFVLQDQGHEPVTQASLPAMVGRQGQSDPTRAPFRPLDGPMFRLD
jgi:hypothetical protein